MKLEEFLKLQRLIDNCIRIAEKHQEAKEKLETFCYKNWGYIPTDSKDFGLIDGIADAVDYGHRSFKADEFIFIMNKIKSENDGQ